MQGREAPYSTVCGEAYIGSPAPREVGRAVVPACLQRNKKNGEDIYHMCALVLLLTVSFPSFRRCLGRAGS